MLSDAQLFYLEEVLGVSPRQFSVEASAPFPIAVVSTHLSPDERTLLSKILSSVNLQIEPIEVGRVEDIVPDADHVLVFGAEKTGRETRARSVYWGFPSLSEMLGNSPAVNEKKKSTWGLLQQFSKEIRQ